MSNYVPMIGVDKLHYAKILSDSSSGFTTEEPVAIPGLTEAGFNMNPQSATFYADNGAYASAAGMGEFTGAIACADITPELRAELYGFDYDATTGELAAADINPPDVAIQYRIQKANGAFRYVTLYKMKATPNEEKITTKGGTINFQTSGFALKGAKRQLDGRVYRILDSDDVNLPAGVTPEDIENGWFTDVNWVVSHTA